MSGFATANRIVMEAEGGLADLPWDKGGRTNYGITTATWMAWRDRLGKPGTPVDACTPDDARTIYHADYWLAGKCDALPWPLSFVHYDSLVQHGNDAGTRMLLQKALNQAGATPALKVDGDVGAKTLAAAGAPARAVAFADELIWTRLLYYRSLLRYRGLMQGIPGNYAHIRGWIARMYDVRDFALGRRRAVP